MNQQTTSPIRQIAVIGTYLPRQCGIATFTTDFCEALARQFPEADVFAIPINDGAEHYDYPARVRFEIAEQDIESYRCAADFLNTNEVDLVVLQHEYGIFGGVAGGYVFELLRQLRMPIVSVLHTVLSNPNPMQRQALDEVVRLSDRLVVMSYHARDLLCDLYQAPSTKIAYIPHGIPDVPFADPNFYKDQFNAEGKSVLLSFGLLSPNKGIEYAIAAMPTILEHNPNVVYFILGATHPQVRRNQGEAYRLMLQQLAREQGVEQQVVFYDRFVMLKDLVEFIGAADLYITPYLNPEQVVSGTLAYTVGTGKVVISTPYIHATELLGEGRGVLVPFRDSTAIAQAVITLLKNDATRTAMRKRAYLLGRSMTWARVAEQYQALFFQALSERLHGSLDRHLPHRLAYADEFPPIRLDQLRRMTDSTGLLQHATFSIPNYKEGYSIDDNARGLLAAIFLEELGIEKPEIVEDLAIRYLSFLAYAFNSELGRFRNLLPYDGHWLEDRGSEDSHARALWALGVTIGRSAHSGRRGLANALFLRALPAVLECTSPRAWAFTLFGISDYLKRFQGDRSVQRIRDEIAHRLMRLYQETATAAWPWFEDRLTYDNASLPRALLLAGSAMGRTDYVEAALTALNWLAHLQSGEDGHFVPIGCRGFYPCNEGRARFDQQPIEAYATVAAYLDAFRVTENPEWRHLALVAFRWFLGDNDLQIPLVDLATGACYDGLQPNGVNLNQGAESTLAYLLASLELRLAEAGARAEEAAREAIQLLTENASSSPV